MSDDYSEYMADGEDSHPALRGFNRPWAMIKHVAGKALKWAAIGAIAGALVIGAIGLIGGGPAAAIGSVLKLIPFVGEYLGGKTAEVGLSAIMDFGLKGLTFGAIAGSALGGLSGVVGAGDAADAQAETMVSNAQAREAREYNRQMLELQREQQLVALRQQQMELMGSPLPMDAPTRQTEGRSI